MPLLYVLFLKYQSVEIKVHVCTFNYISDNIFSIKSWIKNKFCFEDSVIDKQFGIPEDFDYLE